ncbi:MAG: Ig-like domain-containing protein, partial [Chloroflexi bacterium]|nr:Ig-like domain-containing protein [Chloroflexota bacterium]
MGRRVSTPRALGTNLSNVVGVDFNAPGERVNVTLADTNTSPVVGTIDDIRVVSHNTSTDVTRVSVVAIAFAGNGTNPPIITLQLDFGGDLSTNFDIQYPTSSVEEITATIKSVVDSGGTSVLTLTETGRDTGRFEGFVKVAELVTTGGTQFVTGAPGDGLAINTAATIPAIGGPITITYVDALTSGTATDVNRIATLTIDVTPPTVTISAPLSGSESQNRLPTFTGNVTDNQSGIDVSGFALHIDPSTDLSDDGDSPKIITAGASDAGLPAIVAASAASIDLSALSDGINTLAFSHTQTVVLPNTGVTNPDHVVDYQGLAIDLAGNFGYSDSDTSKGNIEGTGRHGNQPHTIKIDQIIPQFTTESLVNAAETGLGFNADDPDTDETGVRDSIKLIFDGNIKDSSVSPSDFQIVFDGAGGTFVPASVVVNGANVYLDLDSTIPSDNKPTITIQGTIQDLAGNSTDAGSTIAVDGLKPVVTVTLSGGSGTGTGDEAADSLTDDKITVTVTSDEDLQGSPVITVTQLTGAVTGSVITAAPAVALGGNTWSLEVSALGKTTGERAVKVIATDVAGNPATDGDDTTKAYDLDTSIASPDSSPGPDGETTQSNPFITTDYKAGGETSTVTITSATLQEESLTEVDVTSSVIASADGKTFFFQPAAALNNAEYTYVVKATDAAGNELTTTT